MAPVTTGGTDEVQGTGTTFTSATATTQKMSSPRNGQAGESAVDSKPSEGSSSKTWAIVGGALKMTLSGVVPFIPDPFKGPAEVLLKIIDVFEVSWPSLQSLSFANNA